MCVCVASSTAVREQVGLTWSQLTYAMSSKIS